MQHAVDLMLRTTRRVASDIPLGLETAYRVQRHLQVPVDPMEIIQVSDTAVPDLVDALDHAGYTNPRQMLRHVWRHGAWTGLVAAPRRYKNLANSETPPAHSDFRGLNVSAQAASETKRSEAVLNAADITSRLSHSLYVARTEAGLSQERLADQVGVRSDQIGKWENGRVRMSEPHVLRFMNFFPYDLGWWYQDHPNGNRA